MTLAQLQVLIAAAKAGSFTRAAEDIGFTQSAVSQMISSLEKELGVSLFHRSRSGITPTSIGERMLQHARDILQITACMTQEAASARNLDTGTLRIAALNSVASRLLPGLLGDFRKRYPSVEIILFEGKNDEIDNWIASSVVDIGITVHPDSDLQTLPLIQDLMMVILPESHPLCQEPLLSFSQIEERCFIMPRDACVKNMLHNNGIYPKSTFEVGDISTILTMVQEYIGVSILPELYIPQTIPKIVAIPLDPPITRQLVLAVRNWQAISPVTAEFAVHCQKYISSLEKKAVRSSQT
ncbi:LysR family transcriptional regulator [Brevibacillus choshinensis]|uniref:LysR family transcriptional regulator n=1 Tax=Brevibacillus choshinensis TaxID=54911 RepID=A0ABX7FKD5_BRECH|nr:LysR family transcriptional regulator [Brevibacillus choshinensis]QRG66315.1 LysR family transcriptional regulator [Brevibacillus choshinensis]